jgi:hypothetical protein
LQQPSRFDCCALCGARRDAEARRGQDDGGRI